MRIHEPEAITHFYLDGGFVEVSEDVVSVLTGRAIPAEQLDLDVLQGQLDDARTRPAHSPELIAQRDRAVAQLRAQLRVARRAL
jgi:F-type H+-transporting ATPase subunit epsilon